MFEFSDIDHFHQFVVFAVCTTVVDCRLLMRKSFPQPFETDIKYRLCAMPSPNQSIKLWQINLFAISSEPILLLVITCYQMLA
jgi:hypothetical protein